MSKADVSDASRNVQKYPDKAHNLCYTVEELVVIDSRSTLGWSGWPGFCALISAEAAHAHCNTTIDTAQLLDGRNYMIAKVKEMER